MTGPFRSRPRRSGRTALTFGQLTKVTLFVVALATSLTVGLLGLDEAAHRLAAGLAFLGRSSG